MARSTRSTMARPSNATVSCCRVASASLMGCIRTGRTETGHFHRNIIGPEADVGGGVVNDFGNRRGRKFQHVTAAMTDQEHALVADASVGTADKGVQGRNAMDQSILLEKIQSAIDRWWCCVMPVPGQHCQYIVGAQRAVGLPDQF